MSWKNWAMLTLLFMAAGNVFSLERNVKMGKPTDEEMTMTAYDPDPEAKAVVLFSETEVHYEFNIGLGDFRLVYYHKERIKVLAAEGVEAGNGEITFVDPEEPGDSKEFVNGLKVTTYNMEGGKVVKSKMSGDLQNKERIDKYSVRIKFAAPNVKVGSVIEYEYRLNSDFYFSPKNWYAQGDYPVFYTRYSIAVPDWFGFRCYSGGMCHLSGSRSEDHFSISGLSINPITTTANVHVFEGSELPALKGNGFIYCEKDYCTRVEHEMSYIQMPGQILKNYNKSWTSLAYSLYKDGEFGARYKMKNPLAVEQKELNLPADMPAEEKVERLRQLLLENYKWNDSYSIWGASSRQIRNDKDRELNMGSMNFTLMSMIRDAGLKVHPVVMSRRSKGRLPIYPSSRYFNAMALRVDTSDSTYFYVDPTAEGYPVGVLPPELLVNTGIVIYTDYAKQVDLHNSSDGRINSAVHATISADGTLKGHADINYLRQSAGAMRASYRAAKDSVEFAQKRATDDNVTITSYQINNVKDHTSSVKEVIDFTQDLQVAGDMIYINPFLFVDAKSPFTEEKRMLPVEFPYANSMRQSISLTLPEGYDIEALPKSKSLNFNDGMFVRTKISGSGNTINISYNYMRKDMLIPVDLYENLCAYYGEIESTTQEMIILKKKQ